MCRGKPARHRHSSKILEDADISHPTGLNVDDVEEAVAFYSTLFGTEPAKRRPGYANFAITEPLPGAEQGADDHPE